MEPITAENVDLTSCDRELIQYPEAIQPHGVMLTVDETSGHIVHASANCAAALGVGPEHVLGKLASSVLGRSERDWLGALKRTALDAGPVHLARESFVDSDRGYHLFAHRSGGLIVLEMELARAAADPPARLYSDLRTDIAKLQATRSLDEFFALAVQRIRDFTGYDRVMAYRFDEDGSGEVVAESKRDELEGYLGLHYPASDIPAPARRLFSLSWVRHLPDVDYVAAPLVAAAHAVVAGPIDMSYAALRSVSVMYSAYLSNMGVRSSMVMPLMKEGRLWGLISAMHHSGPRHVPHETRMAAEFLAHTLSLMMSAKEDAGIFERVLATGAATDKLIEALSRDPAPQASLPQVLALVEAGGAAFVGRDAIARVGKTPAQTELRALAQWLAAREGPIFATDRLATLYPAAEGYAGVASGVLAARLGENEWLIWLRPEQVADVSWAGDPHKPVDVVETEGAIRLRPRGSFALWKESVRHRSTPWRDYEKDAALKLAAFGASRKPAPAPPPQRADEFAEAASLELKSQVRGLQHLAVQLSRRQGEAWDEEGRSQVAAMLRITQRIDGLADALMSHAHIGRGLDVETVDLDALVDEALAAARLDPAIELRRPTRLGVAVCHRGSLAEVFASLIDNAARYNDKPARRIEIGVMPGEPKRYYVGDNGVGVAAGDRDLIFQAFRRLGGDLSGGAGVGLAFARRIVERHGGRLWVESTPGEGSTFVFTLAPEADAAA
jgi:light-regulated signal transduction histidine kinase (bacteriophytochrome)